jgi:hypothetical protein
MCGISSSSHDYLDAGAWAYYASNQPALGKLEQTRIQFL